MIRVKNKLTVLKDDGETITDLSNDAIDFARDNFDLQIGSSQYCYVGFSKPINVFFTAFATANSDTSGTLSGEYYNGSSWTSLSGYHDDTKNFTRDGFITWDRNQTDEAKTTVNSVEQYWYRFQPDVNQLTVSAKGLNLIFADDQDLKREYFEISDFLPSGESSFILTHVACRDHIIQVLRNSGDKKRNSSGNFEDLTAFDLLEMGQIKLAATYLALSKIFSNVQDDEGDIWRQKSIDYHGLYSMAQKNGFIDIDFDDDGIRDANERTNRRDSRIVRI